MLNLPPLQARSRQWAFVPQTACYAQIYRQCINLSAISEGFFSLVYLLRVRATLLRRLAWREMKCPVKLSSRVCGVAGRDTCSYGQYKEKNIIYSRNLATKPIWDSVYESCVVLFVYATSLPRSEWCSRHASLVCVIATANSVSSPSRSQITSKSRLFRLLKCSFEQWLVLHYGCIFVWGILVIILTS